MTLRRLISRLGAICRVILFLGNSVVSLRRLSFILIAQQLGLSLAEIDQVMRALPHGRTPTARDWRMISAAIRDRINTRIAQLERTRDRLDGCIGCGCLSLEKCAIYNPDDRLGAQGPGPRQIVGA